MERAQKQQPHTTIHTVSAIRPASFPENYAFPKSMKELRALHDDSPVQYDDSFAEEDQIFPNSLEELRIQRENNPRLATAKRVGTRIWQSPVVAIVVYSFMALTLLLVILFNNSGEKGSSRDIFGYSLMRIISGSMQSEIPENSLIVTRSVNPNNLRIGNDISFVDFDGAVVTHRIITVFHDHEDSGQPAFRTKGIENRMPDADLVFPDDIIGRVVFSSYTIGRVIAFLQRNLIVTGIMTVIILGLFILMRVMFGRKRMLKKMNIQRDNKQALALKSGASAIRSI